MLGTRHPKDRYRLPATPGSASKARRVVKDLEGVVPPRRLEDICLLVSELVTNAVRHAGVSPDQEIEVRVHRRAGVLRIEVVDPGPGFDVDPKPPREPRESGYGLYLVSQLADRWGVGLEPTRVWFEIGIENARAAGRR